MSEPKPAGAEERDDAPLSRSLAVLRASQGLTQADWAEASGVRAASISSYEGGKLSPSYRMVARLLAAIDLPLAALDSTKGFLEEIRSMRRAGERPGDLSSALPGAIEGALRQELEALALDLGRVASRVTKLLSLLLLAGLPRPPT